MTKEQFLSQVIFKDDDERSDALFYIKVKGLFLHVQIFNYLTKGNEDITVTWKQISDEFTN